MKKAVAHLVPFMEKERKLRLDRGDSSVWGTLHTQGPGSLRMDVFVLHATGCKYC